MTLARDGLAFYAPMKPPDDPTPSGDRTLARALLAACDGLPTALALRPRLASRLVARDGRGDPVVQAEIAAAAAAEAARLGQTPPPAVWLTYHNYYKAPDLLGPPLSRRWAIPYAIVEASRARKRLEGPWAGFARAAETASDAANVIFYMTERDRPALEAARPPHQRLIRLRPFLGLETAPDAAPPPPVDGPIPLIAIGMLRPGDKTASYAALAAALGHVSADWRLEIVGDGPAEAQIRARFAGFGARVRFWGRLEGAALAERLRAAALLVWPGVNEAFGLVYLEAQAAGVPIVCEDRPGVRDVVRAGGLRAAPDAPEALAAAIDALAANPDRRAALGAAGRAQVAAEHLLPAARAVLAAGLAPPRRRQERPA